MIMDSKFVRISK